MYRCNLVTKSQVSQCNTLSNLKTPVPGTPCSVVLTDFRDPGHGLDEHVRLLHTPQPRLLALELKPKGNGLLYVP